MDDQTTRPKRGTRSLILPLTLAAVLGGGVAAASVVAVGGTDGSTPATVTVGAACHDLVREPRRSGNVGAGYGTGSRCGAE